MNHAGRDHALLSASGASRWMSCPASVHLETQFPDTTSEYAKEGTLAHELAEAKARHYFFTKDFTTRKFNAAVKKLKADELWHDEMENCTDVYLDFVKAIALSFKNRPYIALEKKVDFSDWVPQGFGTADCIIISGDILHVIDYKHGKGVPVSPENNSQLMLYALGAYDAYKMLFDIKKVNLSIVQPRLSVDAETWECSLEDLLAFGDTARDKAMLALSDEGKEVFNPGDACRFCRARTQCRARADHNIELAFAVGKIPPLISNDEVGEYLKQGEDVKKWIEELKDYALKECLMGNEVAGWKAVEGRGSRDWADMDKAFEILEAGGIDEALLWERKPLTLAQVEKVVGKKDFADMVGDMVVKKPGKPTLVHEEDKRKAITNVMSAEDAFKN